MKRFILLAALLSVIGTAFADQYVGGYMRRDGTYVQPHYRSSPDNSLFNNYSSRGNTNPYTNERGYGRNEFSNPPAYSNPYGRNPYDSNPYNNNNSYGNRYNSNRRR